MGRARKKNRGTPPYGKGKTRREAGTQSRGSGDEPDSRATEEGVRNWRSSPPRRPPCFFLQAPTNLLEGFLPRCLSPRSGCPPGLPPFGPPPPRAVPQVPPA